MSTGYIKYYNLQYIANLAVPMGKIAVEGSVNCVLPLSSIQKDLWKLRNAVTTDGSSFLSNEILLGMDSYLFKMLSLPKNSLPTYRTVLPQDSLILVYCLLQTLHAVELAIPRHPFDTAYRISIKLISVQALPRMSNP